MRQSDIAREIRAAHWSMGRIVFTVAMCAAALPANAEPLHLTICGNRPNTSDKTCLVDGDRLWMFGENIRLQDFETPGPQTQICGGAAEVALAHRASARRLATIRIDGHDVGDILIAEGLARR